MQEWPTKCYSSTGRSTFARLDQGGFNKDGRGVGVGGDERVMKTTERPGFLAKNRLSMPEEIPFTYESYSQFVPSLS